MCEICRQYPCHPRCPNAPEPPIFDTCEKCGEPIYEGDEYVEIDDSVFCTDCAESTYADEDEENTPCESCGEPIEYDSEIFKLRKKCYCSECATTKIAYIW